jgi:hypothetical protein
MEIFILPIEVLEKLVKDNLFLPGDAKLKRIFIDDNNYYQNKKPELKLVIDSEFGYQTAEGYEIPQNNRFCIIYDDDYFYENFHL